MFTVKSLGITVLFYFWKKFDTFRMKLNSYWLIISFGRNSQRLTALKFADPYIGM